jgi:hypothetical protein
MSSIVLSRVTFTLNRAQGYENNVLQKTLHSAQANPDPFTWLMHKLDVSILLTIQGYFDYR